MDAAACLYAAATKVTITATQTERELAHLTITVNENDSTASPPPFTLPPSLLEFGREKEIEAGKRKR